MSSSSDLPAAITTKTSVSQRRTLTHAEMDAIGNVDDNNFQKGNIGEKDVEVATDATTAETIDTPPHDSSPSPMVAMEISESDDQLESEDIDEDLERLLGDSIKRQAQPSRKKKRGCCSCKTRLVGNHTIVCGDYFDKTGWGIVSPQWFGPGCVVAIVAWASFHFLISSWNIGPVTTAICAIFALSTLYNLVDTAFRDPGICMDKVRPENTKDAADYVWCDFCR